MALWALISSSNSFETAPSGLAVLVTVLVAIALDVIAVWLYTRWMFLSPVIVLERSPVLQAFRRSWRLVSGSFWRIFGILVVSGLITSVASSVLNLPLQLIGGVAAPLMIDPNNQTMAFVFSMISKPPLPGARHRDRVAVRGGGRLPALPRPADAQGRLRHHPPAELETNQPQQ